MKKTLTFTLTLIGIVLFCFLTLRTGLHAILMTLTKVGISGFAVLLICQILVNFLLGLAWKGSISEISLLRLIASRSIRDAAAACLPFSQLGGMLIGIRVTTAGHPRRTTDGTPFGWPEGVAANLVDITTELLGQIAFILLAIFCLIGHQDAGRFIWPSAIGMALLSIGIAGFIWTQQRSGNILKRLVRSLAGRLKSEWQDSLTDNTENFQDYMETLWNRPARIACGASLHLLCWLCSAALTWLALFFLGVHLTLFNAFAIEGVVCGIMSIGFLVPGALGVQEGAYVALGLVFGLSPDIAFSLSLLRRGRDIVIGIPVLLLWQLYEFRQLRHSQSSSS